MHPAPSIIFFTVMAGAGYGLVIDFCLAILVFGLVIERIVGAVIIIVALIFIVAGLSSSVLHLRRPSRARLALSQWRSSWLSREGVAALVTFVPLVVLLACYGMGLETPWLVRAALIASAIGALATIICTAMIYASLRSIPSWHQPLVPLLYLLFGLMAGSLILVTIMTLAGIEMRAVIWPVIAIVLVTWFVKLLYWRGAARHAGSSSPQSATGLSGRLRPIYAPHSEANYLLDEMGFRVGRKHSDKLKRLALIFGALIPCLLLLLLQGLSTFGVIASILAVFALLGGLISILIERWLFFAEARHTVMHYYEDTASALGR
ncbi:MAG: DmsC/YnfH family molybdoenzyme membrane anchor subunit [Pseudomonadota bacterium]